MRTTESSSIQIPGYELLEKVGEGGMGAVYRARQLSLQRMVAVKVLRDGAGRDFQRETQLLASLSHPNVVAIFDCSQSNGHSFLVTEFVPGTSLRSLMKPGEPWDLARAATLLDRVAGALAFIHRHGILHLDLKPENVLCTPEGDIKIADFGLAQSRTEARAFSEHDPARGTLDYCSLEQRHGLPTDERSDLYSLAVLSYELLTGCVSGRAYESACRINPKLPADVDTVLRRGLSRRPEQRQESVERFRCELMAALRPKNRRLRAALMSGGVLAALIAIVLLAAMFFRRDTPVDQESEAASTRAWLIAEDPESLKALGALTAGLAEPAVNVQVHSPYPDGKGDPPLPRWPSPRPALFVASAAGCGFFHPLSEMDAGRELLDAWPGPAKRSRLLPEDNWIHAGDFSGDRLWFDDGGAWAKLPGPDGNPGDGMRVACPPDRPDDPALLLESDSAAASLRCYQWLSRLPERPGTVMVLRYRARTESGNGRLSVGPTLPLYIPEAERDPAAEALRRRSSPHANSPPKAGFQVREYRLDDCVQPAAEWQTYCVMWQWPPYCTEAGHRNILVEYRGAGKAWLDDLELFTWERGSKQ